jgi:Tfp pilus assembly protein PilO
VVNLLEQIGKDIVGIGIAIIGFVVWLVRLEARLNAAYAMVAAEKRMTEARIKVLEDQRHEDLKAALQSRSEVIDMLAEQKKDIGELRTDIKQLLQRMPK